VTGRHRDPGRTVIRLLAAALATVLAALVRVIRKADRLERTLAAHERYERDLEAMRSADDEEWSL
jgi:type II secretory pathway pseudopilin PulG